MRVVVFALRGCPLAALGPYGNEWIATPNLDRLAAEAVVFDRHTSDCPDPTAARRAWRTGRDQLPPPPVPEPEPEPEPDLLALLTARTVRTALVRHTRPANDAHAEFYAGWDDLFDARPDPADPSPGGALVRALPGVLDHLAGHPDWLLWIEIDRLTPPWHAPQDVFEVYVEDLTDEDEPDEYEPDEPDDDDEETAEPEAEAEPVRPWADPPTGWFDTDDLASWELLHRSLAAALTSFDADLGRVFDLLRDRGLGDAAWVFTADHGYPLGEHGLIGLHRPWLHDELVHVPLIVRLPGGAEAGRRVPALTQPADLMPTLAGWFGADAGPGLFPLLRGEADAIRPAACSVLTLGPAAEWAIRTPEWALLLPVRPHPDDDSRGPTLFVQPDDRWEVNDLRTQHLEVAEELERTLRAAVEPPA